MTFRADYPGAIVVEAANYGYIINNNPKGFVYHTPEEDADDDPQTPRYLAGTTRNASYTYFVSYLGFVFQLVPERHGAYANAVIGKPYPTWASATLPPPANNLNLQCISVSFEGHAATIHRTMVRGQSQWNAGVNLVAHRAKRLRISSNNWARHADVSVARSDPGSLDLVTFTLDVKAKMEDDMTEDEKQWVRQEITKFLSTAGGGHLPNIITAEILDGRINDVITRTHRGDPHGGGSGVSEADAHAIAKDEIDLAKLKAAR